MKLACATGRKTVDVKKPVVPPGRGEHHRRLGKEVARNSAILLTNVGAAWFAPRHSECQLSASILERVLPTPAAIP